jgi:hypothetical protein
VHGLAIILYVNQYFFMFSACPQYKIELHPYNYIVDIQSVLSFVYKKRAVPYWRNITSFKLTAKSFTWRNNILLHWWPRRDRSDKFYVQYWKKYGRKSPFQEDHVHELSRPEIFLKLKEYTCNLFHVQCTLYTTFVYILVKAGKNSAGHWSIPKVHCANFPLTGIQRRVLH